MILKREDWIELDPDVDQKFIAAVGEEKLAELEKCAAWLDETVKTRNPDAKPVLVTSKLHEDMVRCMVCGKEVSVEDADMWCPCGGNWYSERLIETTNPDGTKSFHMMFGIQPKNPTGMIHGTVD